MWYIPNKIFCSSYNKETKNGHNAIAKTDEYRAKEVRNKVYTIWLYIKCTNKKKGIYVVGGHDGLQDAIG